MRRSPYLPVAPLLLLTLLVASLARAQLDVEEVRLDPAAPTWQDAVSARLDVVSTCFTGDEVDEEIAVEHSLELGVGRVVTLVVPLDCRRDPALPLPYELTSGLGHLTPGDYLLRVELENEDVVHEQAFAVHPVADLLLDLPDHAVHDLIGFDVRVAGIASCGIFLDATVGPGNVVEIFADRNCPILPPGETYTEAEIEIGPLSAGEWEIRLFDTSFAPQTPPPLVRDTLTVYHVNDCVPSDTVLCLNDDRFKVAAGWHGFQGGAGDGQAIPLPERDDTGMFWFFDEDNVELTVKVLDGCGVNGHYWVFVASGSTVGYQLLVTDTLTDDQVLYQNPLGATPALIPDTAAFATCP
jgi:hypothetical protein